MVESAIRAGSDGRLARVRLSCGQRTAALPVPHQKLLNPAVANLQTALWSAKRKTRHEKKAVKATA